MPTVKIEFAQLEKEIASKPKAAIQRLAPELGKAYVVSITRDECPACRRYKPKLERLSKAIVEKYGGNVVFVEVHVRYASGRNEESLRSKDVFGHYFYPTSMILVRTRDRGTVELYRNVSPTMTELGKNISSAVQTAVSLAKET